MASALYSSDLTDARWGILQPLLRRATAVGRPRRRDLREVVGGIPYVLRSGCPWRSVPEEDGHWSTCYSYFRRWREDGTRERAMGALRRRERGRRGRDPDPSGLLVASESVKTTGQGGS